MYKSTKSDDIKRSMLKIENSFERFIGEKGYNLAKIGIVNSLLTMDKPTQKEIAKKNYLPKQTVNNFILELVSLGFASFKGSKDDKREKTIILSKEGRKALEDILAPQDKFNKEVLKRFGKDKADELLSLLKEYGNAIDVETRLL